MSRRPSLSDAEAAQAEIWFRDYERIGTFSAKARELHVATHTLRDAIRRVRGLDTRPLKRKLSFLEIDSLATELLGGVIEVPRETKSEREAQRETAKTGEQQSEDADEV